MKTIIRIHDGNDISFSAKTLTRDMLRRIARRYGVARGRNREDTTRNLIAWAKSPFEIAK